MAMVGAPRIVYVITDAAPPARARPLARLRTALLMLLAALVLLVTAADAYLTARIGVRPLIPAVRRLFALLAAECRTWVTGAAPAQVVDDPDRKVWR
ncbi:hypothetical protein HNP84_002602 [Thermocatellispora tengchongensis]|uniref:Uncharacterized protein n=1 Tax=Thermocatellispora tengchongensis TaxID=1073253 RepID=A0A840P4U3_9ACTN|nr:hypothetical protein [Thermocatellispora tengchongensis]MBB5132881.1 hypothetical protein [Thermocatellispora tengchongensis]